MKKSMAIPACCFLLSLLLTGCMGGVQPEGKTINDMVIPSAAVTASGGNAGVQATASSDAGSKETPAITGANAEENAMLAVFNSYSAPNNCQLDITIALDETFTRGRNAVVVPLKLEGTIKSVLSPLVKMSVKVSSNSSFDTQDMNFTAEWYMEQTIKRWITYSNESGKWVRTVQSVDKTPAVKITKTDWEAFASSVKNAKQAGIEEVDGVRTAKMEASVKAELVNRLFGAQLCYVVPGMQAAPKKEKASDKSVPVAIWISEKSEICKMQFNTGEAWKKLVADSFSARSTDDLNVSVQNVSIIVTVTKLNKLEEFEMPVETQTPAVTPAPTGTTAKTPAKT
ncbi:MAG: hypothetical protein ACOYU3_04390 [Bacillota bacterium]